MATNTLALLNLHIRVLVSRQEFAFEDGMVSHGPTELLEL
jgi:hypothetical protein